MPSVVSKKTQRIFTYLLGTVGIVFIILLLTRQIREGFQTPPEPAATPSVSEFALQRQEECIKNMNDVGSINCQEQTIDGGTVYTCDDEESALEILKCDTLFSQTLDPKHTPFYGLKDSICYRNALSNIYVCYNRPPITVFDDSTKTNEFLNPSYPNMDDPVPGYLAAQYPTICPGYQASYTMLHSGISTLSTNLLLVNTNIGIISSVFTTLVNISTSYCGTSRTRTVTGSNTCKVISTSISSFYDTLNNTTTRNISTILNSSLTQLRYVQMNKLIPAYTGLNCSTPTFK